MGKNYKIILGAMLFIIGLSIYMEATKPTPLNWYPNYTKKVSTPLGAKAIHLHFENEMQTNPNVTEINKSTFEAFQQEQIEDNGSILFFNNKVDIDEKGVEKLLDWVSEGNSVFISSSDFPKVLKDTLQLKIKKFLFDYRFTYDNDLSLTNPNFNKKKYPTANEYEAIYFSEIDTAAHVVLGYIRPNGELDDDELEVSNFVNFIEAPFNKGKIYLHTFPQAFGNHFFVHKDNYQYTTSILQYLNWNKPLYIDQYYKTGKETIDSFLYYVVQNRALKWAYYTAIFASLIFVFVQGKRKQQPIPIKEPMANKTYEYTKTVANMFLEEKAHKAIAQKQITQFLNTIRKQYLISTREINQSFYAELAMKCAVDIDHIKKTFTTIQQIERQEQISKEELLRLDKMIRKITK